MEPWALGTSDQSPGRVRAPSRRNQSFVAPAFMMKATVFYSWQSDTHAPLTEDVLHRALTNAVGQLAADANLVVRAELDHDTKSVPGSPPMIAAILQRIDQCSFFVGDVTLTYQGRMPERQRFAPNPNVLLEVGYAIKRLGHERVLLIFDLAHGSPEQLPFDLRSYRVITFDSRAEGSSLDAGIPAFSTRLHAALQLMLTGVGVPADIAPPVQIDLRYIKKSQGRHRHEYRLPVRVINGGTDVLSDWSLEVTFPRALLESRNTYPVDRALPDGMVVMQQTEARHSGPIYPGTSNELLGIDYFVDDAIFEQADILFKKTVVATLYAGSKRVAQTTVLVGDLQNF
jgi:hypothetical protein